MGLKRNTYILEGHAPVLEPDLIKWGEWMDNNSRKVKNSRLEVTQGNNKIGFVEVSTIFLGVDHNFSEKGDPILFETMIFGGPHDQEMDRCSTREGAEQMHEKMKERIMRE